MIRTIGSALENLDVEYADIRFDEERKTRITLNGDQVEHLSTFGPRGGYVRAVHRGGKATASFGQPEDAAGIARETSAAAHLASKHRATPIVLARIPAVQSTVMAQPKHDPREVSLAEKHDLLRHYSRLAMETPGALMTQFMYEDSASRRIFVSTEGTEITHEHLIATILGIVVARRGDVVQRGLFAIGGCEDFGRLIDRDEDLRQALGHMDELLSAPAATPGTFPIVLDPIGGGIFIHEAFGHLSEADLTVSNHELRQRLSNGLEIGSPILNVIDDPTLPARSGSYAFDDEGVPAQKTPLITGGRIAGRLHSRETAAAYDEPVTGNCRASDAGFGPVVRMSNTYIDAGTSSLDEMIASIDDGYYIAGGAGGQGGIDFTFGARWGRRIRHGRLAEMVRDVNMSGNLFSTLKGISMIGTDLAFTEYCDCGKGSFDGVQLFNRIGVGAPHIRIDAVTVGGA